MANNVAPEDFPDTATTTAVTAVQQDCNGVQANRVVACENLPVEVIRAGSTITAFFTNDEYGPNMGQVPDTTATLIQWVNGGGLTGEPPVGQTPWAYSQLTGSGWDQSETDFIFTPLPDSGSVYVSAIDGTAGSSALFQGTELAANIPTLAAVTHFSFYLLVQSWNLGKTGEDATIRFRNLAGASISSTVSIKNYLPASGVSGWINLRIPIADFAITESTIPQVVFEITHAKVNIGFDNIQFHNIASEGLRYTVEPPPGFMYVVESLNWTIVDTHPLTPTGMPRIDHDKIGAVTLVDGLLFELISDDFPTVRFITTAIFDVVRVGATVATLIGGTAGDKVTLQLKSNQARPFTLRSSRNESINYVVRDDLSGIEQLQICAISAMLPDPDYVP